MGGVYRGIGLWGHACLCAEQVNIGNSFFTSPALDGGNVAPPS